MAYRPTANLRKIKLDALGHPCPEAHGRSQTRQPRAALDRWKILRHLLVDAWSNPGEPDEEVLARNLGVLSRLEADLIRRMFLNVKRIFPLPEGATLDLEGRNLSWDDDEAGVTTSVYVTVSVTHADGEVEHVRLKTGRRPSTPEESAVLWQAAEPGETFTDLMAWPGEVEPIEPPPDIESRLADVVESSPALTASGVRPGPGCVWCPRTALCGAFPAGRVVPSSARHFNLTKTDVESLGHCHRRTAWRRVHAIPRDDGEEAGAPDRISQGRLFHALVAASHGSDDPQATVTDFLDGVPPSEVADLRLMWEQHLGLIAREGLEVRVAEFPVGLTLLEGERADTRGVTIIGFVDLTARDSGGAPVAIELKTGSAGDTQVENDLYAAGMRRWVGAEPIIIHRHYVRSSPPQCEVVTLGEDEIEAAAARLRNRVAPVYGWDWDEPLQPGYTVGPWCGGCEFRITCESYR